MKEIITESLVELSEKIVEGSVAITSVTCAPGLIFLKYLCYLAEKKKTAATVVDDVKTNVILEFLNLQEPGNVFIPPEARFEYLCRYTKDINLGKYINDALHLIDGLNFYLRGFVPKYYDTVSMNYKHLAEFLKNLEDIPYNHANTGDILIHAYDTIVGNTIMKSNNKPYPPIYPRSLYRLMVRLLEPCKGVVLDPCCQIGTALIEAAAFMKEKNPSLYGAAFYGQVLSLPLWHLSCMNIEMNAISSKGISWDLVPAIDKDKFKELKADTLLCSPGDDGKIAGWLQYALFHLSNNGKAALLLPSDTLITRENTTQSMRQELIRNKLLDSVILLPSNIVTDNSLCIWIIDKNRRDGSEQSRKRDDEFLIVDYSEYTFNGARRDNELTESDIKMLSQPYCEWKKRKLDGSEFDDVTDVIKLDELKQSDFLIRPHESQTIHRENKRR